MANGEWDSPSVIHNLLRAHSTAEIQENAGFVANNPGVVARMDGGDIAWREVQFRPVGHDHMSSAGEHIHKVVNLAQIGAGCWLDIVGPAPARVIGGA